VTEKGTERRTDGHGYIDSALDADQEYMYILYGFCHAFFLHKRKSYFLSL